MLQRGLRGPSRAGLILTTSFLLVFGACGSLVPIAGGASAPAIISPDGSRKTIQHLEGGIIETLMVRDGDTVGVGQPLVNLSSIQPRATYETLLEQNRTLLVTRARLLAESAGRDDIELPAELRDAMSDPGLVKVLEGQRQLLRTRHAMHRSRVRVLQQRIEQYQEQITGLQAQVQSTTRQFELLNEEVEGKEQLQRKGILPKPELLRLQRMQAEILGRKGEYVGNIARVRQQIGEAELQISAFDAERADQISTQLDQVRIELAATNERLSASKDILNRTVIRSPVAGKVVNLRFKTEGGVVQRGEPIMDVVPSDDLLLIDARISPNDIDVVHTGLRAQVHLLAYSNRTTPRISGSVRSVSADRLVDESTRQPYYLARVEVDREQVKQIGSSIELVPGMPAEVLIVTGQQTLVQYLIKPFTDVWRRSLREL
ncbi:type I secretion membrane fusion protein, HlyD family [Microvirga lotononidis]|uniref:Membrane fusion protein (MFP) family protein n=1 Tax=Microvirga lotononidis TaxID=864069 RepID=I4Z2Q9_9HYPH|nr:type I secretion membrane fusion protein, HlyD family [Microvirga lotononidis]